MSTGSRLPPGAAGALASARESVYGPGYRQAARAEAFRRSGGICQLCGLFPAEEAHHWGWRYPADADITADDLTPLCCRCHWAGTYHRVTGRMQSGVWFILATGRAAVRERKRAARRLPRACRAPEAPPTPPSAPWAREPDLRTLVERCHLVLVVACLACERSVRLDAVASLPPYWWSLPVTRLGRRLSCCRCRSRSRWLLLGGWPPAGRTLSAGTRRRVLPARMEGGDDRAAPIPGIRASVLPASPPAGRLARSRPLECSGDRLMERLLFKADDATLGADGGGDSAVAVADAPHVTLLLPATRAEYDQARSGTDPSARRRGETTPGWTGAGAEVAVHVATTDAQRRAWGLPDFTAPDREGSCPTVPVVAPTDVVGVLLRGDVPDPDSPEERAGSQADGGVQGAGDPSRPAADVVNLKEGRGRIPPAIRQTFDDLTCRPQLDAVRRGLDAAIAPLESATLPLLEKSRRKIEMLSRRSLTTQPDSGTRAADSLADPEDRFAFVSWSVTRLLDAADEALEPLTSSALADVEFKRKFQRSFSLNP